MLDIELNKKLKYSGNVNLEKLKEFAETHTIKDISEKYGFNGYMLCKRFRFFYNYAPYKRTKIVFNEKKQNIIDELKKGGLSLSKIALMNNCSRQYVHQIKKQLENV